MIYGKAATDYIDLGWHTPLPLPMLHKYPPPEKSTGNYPDVDDMDIEYWIEQRADDNIGLRMPKLVRDGKALEVIGIDVDHYDDKTGMDTIEALEDRLGPLPDTWKSTSRGPDAMTGIFFFVVPAGQKWAGQVGPGVETIQRTHRYAVVAPSVVREKKGSSKVRRYSWYREDDGVDVPSKIPPNVQDLPMLPAAWQKHLQKGLAEERRVMESDPELASMKGVRSWMQKNLPGYSEQPSSEMALASDPELLAAEAAGGAHEMLVSRSHRVIMLAAEGHHGCQAALENVQTAFYDEVLGKNTGDARRSMDDARREVNRAIGQEVEKLKADVDDGYIAISTVGGFSADDTKIDTSVVLKQFLKRRSLIVDASDYDDSDAGRAQMFLDAYRGEIRAVSGTNEWAWWNPAKNRLELIESNFITKMWLESVVASLKHTAGTLLDTATAQEENGLDDYKETRKRGNDMLRRSKLAGNRNQRISSLGEAHNLCENPIRQEQFDRNPKTLGVENGVVDFTNPAADILRAGKLEDMILENTRVAYRAGATHPLWDSFLETFLPDEDYRRFVQRVFGYGMIGGNPLRLIVFLQGGTSTGKSTMLRAVENALGGYASTVQTNALFREKQDAGPSPEIITAIPRRMVFASEVGVHNRLHADVIKRLTGGDPISARALYSNQVVTRVPMFTPYIATNSMPTITDGDEALWRRLLVLPFDEQVSPDSLPRETVESNPAALEAVLAWLVEGLIDYLEHGLAREEWPERCIRRARRFVEGTSDFQMFLAEITVRRRGPDKDDARVDAEKLYLAYRTWGLGEGMRESDLYTKNRFTRQMTANGFEKVSSTKRIDGKVTKTAFYRGIELRK